MSANGKVCTGFSKPYVALYSASGSTVTYSNGQILARGVDISISTENSDDNSFYADNVAAESLAGFFSGGELSLTVDGLHQTAEKLIIGLPTPTSTTVGSDTVDIYHYGDATNPPYVGVGFIIRYMSDGVTYYTPMVLTKCRFNMPEISAATQEDEIDWQTENLTAAILRDDTSAHDWKLMGEDQTSEVDAENVVRVLLGLSVLS